MSERYLQNDPDRAGGLIPDAQGEFVEEEPGGAFDPRTFRSRSASSSAAGPASDETVPDGSEPVSEPPMDDERMVGPGEEIDKAHR
jgi:hypothetical protein